MKIAIIDSGVNGKREELKQCKISHVKTKLYCNSEEDNIGHGTAIAYILYKIIPQLEIISFKLFEEGYITTEDEIINVLKDIEGNYSDIDLIHLSNGITYIKEYKRLYDICNKLCEKKQFIISAYDNEGSISYPAAFDNTIGVSWNRLVRNTNQYYYIKNSLVEVLGYAGNQRLPWGKSGYKYVSGSSFAAPYITAKIAEYKMENKDIEIDDVKDRLSDDAIVNLDFPKKVVMNEQKKNWLHIQKIKKAIIFPCNKETIALLANSDLLNFKIAGVYDYEYSSNLQKSTRDFIFGESIVSLKVKPFSDIKWEEDFDTIIVGHLKVINSIVRQNYNKIILEKCAQYKKNSFFFDEVNQKDYEVILDKIRKNGNFLMTHLIKQTNITKFPYGSCHKLNSPALAIVGTSPSQGKYNLQLALRRRFLNDGYEIGQIGTEPTAQLFGMDVAFSNGYENQYQMIPEEEILYLNNSFFEIGSKDILLMGIQSNTIPLKFGNIRFLTYHQQNALIAFEPDCCILCVNYNDDINYINRTIQVLKNYYLTEVIAIVVFPFQKKYDWNISNTKTERITVENERNIKKVLSDKFCMKVYINGKKEDMDKLYEMCIEFFQQS